MTLNEALLKGAEVTVIGLAIVFSVLIILMLVLIAMKKIFYKEETKVKAPTPQVPQSEPEPVAEVDDNELIAVLTAAVAASLNTSTYNLHIKSYRRIGTNAPTWNRAGVRDTIDSRSI